MTQFSMANDDNMTMVDDGALVAHNLKSFHATPVQEPQPEDNQSEEQVATTNQVPETQQKKKSVVFVDADVVEFEPTVWTATISSDGVPVGLSTNVRRRARRRLDSYEGERLLHRINRQEYMEHGYLEPDERLEMLEAAGHSVAIISHVERESVRLNRERWESNEYDLLYQFGLGDAAIMDLDEEEELALSQGTILGLQQQQYFAYNEEEEDDDMLEAQNDEEDDEGNPAEYYYYSSRTQSAQADVDVRFAMEEIDSYDTRKYEEWAWDYTTDCVLGDDNDEYEKNAAFDLPSLDFGLPEMSSSPTDVSANSESMIVSCGKVIGMGSSSSSPSSTSKPSTKAPVHGLFV